MKPIPSSALLTIPMALFSGFPVLAQQSGGEQLCAAVGKPAGCYHNEKEKRELTNKVEEQRKEREYYEKVTGLTHPSDPDYHQKTTERWRREDEAERNSSGGSSGASSSNDSPSSQSSYSDSPSYSHSYHLDNRPRLTASFAPRGTLSITTVRESPLERWPCAAPNSCTLSITTAREPQQLSAELTYRSSSPARFITTKKSQDNAGEAPAPPVPGSTLLTAYLALLQTNNSTQAPNAAKPRESWPLPADQSTTKANQTLGQKFDGAPADPVQKPKTTIHWPSLGLTETINGLAALCLPCRMLANGLSALKPKKEDKGPVTIDSRAAKELRDQTVSATKKYVDQPYAWAGQSLPKGLDCSGFEYRVLFSNQPGEIKANAQNYFAKAQEKRALLPSAWLPQPGDVFFKGKPGDIEHTGFIENCERTGSQTMQCGIIHADGVPQIKTQEGQILTTYEEVTSYKKERPNAQYENLPGSCAKNEKENGSVSCKIAEERWDFELKNNRWEKLINDKNGQRKTDNRSYHFADSLRLRDLQEKQ
ncbi:MAG: C40 family peptidase [Elusimicrobia bacterium]|nr:C40 family peptidase [Elusimicrobiota bacterium]